MIKYHLSIFKWHPLWLCMIPWASLGREFTLYISLHEEAAMTARPHVNQGSGAPDQNLCRKSLPRNLYSGILQRDVSAEANLLRAYSVAIQDSELSSWILDHQSFLSLALWVGIRAGGLGDHFPKQQSET